MIDDLAKSCAAVVLDMLDMNLEPGREDWVRSEECQKELVQMVREKWIVETGGAETMFPWRTDYVILQFIRARKQTRQQKDQTRAQLRAGSLFGDDAGTIYAIRNESGHVKIGWTGTTPQKRMSALQTGSADELTFMGSMVGSMQQERLLHIRFADCRVRRNGEWFLLTQDLRTWIRDNMT